MGPGRSRFARVPRSVFMTLLVVLVVQLLFVLVVGGWTVYQVWSQPELNACLSSVPVGEVCL